MRILENSIHKIRASVIHLMRGQIYHLCGKAIFTFGGAKSNDISGGILDPEDSDYKQIKKDIVLFNWSDDVKNGKKEKSNNQITGKYRAEKRNSVPLSYIYY